MAFSTHVTEEKVLVSLNQRTFVSGANVATAPMAAELGLSGDELMDALENLRQRGWIVLDSNGDAGITGDGHTQLPI
jgi:hypothetical protein